MKQIKSIENSATVLTSINKCLCGDQHNYPHSHIISHIGFTWGHVDGDMFSDGFRNVFGIQQRNCFAMIPRKYVFLLDAGSTLQNSSRGNWSAIMVIKFFPRFTQ